MLKLDCLSFNNPISTDCECTVKCLKTSFSVILKLKLLKDNCVIIIRLFIHFHDNQKFISNLMLEWVDCELRNLTDSKAHIVGQRYAHVSYINIHILLLVC